MRLLSLLVLLLWPLFCVVVVVEIDVGVPAVGGGSAIGSRRLLLRIAPLFVFVCGVRHCRFVFGVVVVVVVREPVILALGVVDAGVVVVVVWLVCAMRAC